MEAARVPPATAPGLSARLPPATTRGLPLLLVGLLVCTAGTAESQVVHPSSSPDPGAVRALLAPGPASDLPGTVPVDPSALAPSGLAPSAFAPPALASSALDPPTLARTGTHRPGEPGDAASPDTRPERVALYSLVLPGSGQYVQGQRRWVAYGAMEAVAWYMHLDRRTSGHDLRDAYRELAWNVPRDRNGPPVVDDFEYYERLAAWTRSGAWDLDPNATGVQPETDPRTFNGAVWKRATEIFFGADPGGADPGDPEWDRALTYYRDRAYPPELLWDWTGTGDARERFESLILKSDDDLGDATLMLGLIVANHILSAADAFVSARLRESTGGHVDAGLALLPRGMLQGRPGAALALRLEVRP